MHHHDDISVTFAEQTGDECDEHTAPNDDSDNVTTTHLQICMICMKPNEPVQVAMQLGPGFDFRDADGLRVIIAIGEKELSPNNAQSFWVSREGMIRDKTTRWSSFWTWSSERAKKRNRFLKAPASSDGDIRQVFDDQWEEALNAPQGGIAVYVTRGTLPGKTKHGCKRCTTDPPESAKFDEETHPIRAEWFEPLPGEAGETYVFVAMNVSEETFDGSPPNYPTDRSGDEDETYASEKTMSSQSQSDHEEAGGMPRNDSRFGTSDLKVPANQHRSVSERTHSPQAVPAGRQTDLKRTASPVNPDSLEENKKIKAENAESETGWQPWDSDKELLIRKDDVSKAENVSPALSSHEKTIADTVDQKRIAHTAAGSSRLVGKPAQSVSQKEELEKKQMKRSIQLRREKVNIMQQEAEYEKRFGENTDE